MRMKGRDFAATLMAALMAGGMLAGCGSADKNVNHNAEITQNTQHTQDVQLTTQAVADNETEATNANDEIETESTIQELETKTQEVHTEVITEDSETSGTQNDSDIQETGSQENIAAEDNEWNSGNNASGESQESAAGGNVNIKDDNSLLASAKVNTVTYSAYASEVLRLVNIEREKVGAAYLVLDGALCNAANMRAIEMDYSGNFSHTRPDGRDCFTVFSFCEISFYTCGENIAAGYPTPAAVVKGWMNSTGHKANILNAAFTKMGLGYSTGDGEYCHYWAQEFAG